MRILEDAELDPAGAQRVVRGIHECGTVPVERDHRARTRLAIRVVAALHAVAALEPAS